MPTPSTTQLIEIENHYQYGQQLRMNALVHASFRTDPAQYAAINAAALPAWYRRYAYGKCILNPGYFNQGIVQEWRSRTIKSLKNVNVTAMTQQQIDKYFPTGVPAEKQYIVAALEFGDNVEVFFEKLLYRDKIDDLALEVYEYYANKVEF